MALTLTYWASGGGFVTLAIGAHDRPSTWGRMDRTGKVRHRSWWGPAIQLTTMESPR